MAQDVAQTHTAGPQDSQTAALANIKAKLDSRNSNSSGTGRTQSAAADALRSLLDAYGKTGVEKAWRNKQLRALGNNKSYPFKSTLEQNVDAMHKTLAIMFNDEKVYKSLATSVKDNNHAEVSLLRGVCEVILQKSTKFQHLLARGSYDSTILHTILNPATYSQGSATDRRLSFDRLKPLIKFLLWLQPELPTVMGQNGTTLLFFVVKPEPAKTHEEDADETSETGSNAGDQDDLFLDGDTKTKIVQFICDQNPDGKGGDTDPVRSLALLHGASQSGDQASAARHAVHAAIESDFKMPDDIIARLKNIKVDFNADESREKVEKACLEVPDRRGRTCLHLALTAPFTRNKITWAKQLVKVQPSLLKLQYGHIRRGEYGAKGEPIVDYMTPLQYLLEQRKPTGMNRHKDKTKTDSSKEPDPLDEEMDDLRDFLKCQCLEYFDYITCKAIMYTRQNEREIFLTLSDETISSEFLKDQRRHYKLDKLLQSVHIASNNRVQWSNNETWDDDNETWDVSARNTARSWNCIGNTDLFMVFHWLKDIVGVKKVFVVVVDDLPRLESAAHSDMAIVECLKGLDVETWNWRRMDIPANVIIDAAGDHVKSLYLYCSGLRAVLQSWSDTKGLVNLKRLERVEVEIHQGLESRACMRKFAEDFKNDMEEIHAERYKVDIEKGSKSKLEVVCRPVYAKETPVKNDAASKVKADSESGFEEQDWLRCMDEFALLMDRIEKRHEVRPIKVALIDDGVKTSYGRLDEIVHCGRCGWDSASGSASTTSKMGDKRKPAKNYPLNYNHSQTGHGTVMAYFIQRVCPRVKLCIAKLECQTGSCRQAGSDKYQPVTFSIESATEAIKWAVAEKVDIISMSWAIEQNGSIQQTQEAQLREAITLAENRGILLFCANPDMNKPGTSDYKNNTTYPKSLVSEKTLFCIGAGTPGGKPWDQIHESDQSCDFILPGVDLRVDPPEEITIRKRQGKPPKEWHKHSGSSLSCALAAGLAAMILHCTLVSGYSPDDRKWKWLRSRDGMRKALQNIREEPADKRGLWLHVRSVFGEAAKTMGSNSKTMQAALHNNVVAKLLRGSPRPSGDGPWDAEPAPGPLKKRATMKDEI